MIMYKIAKKMISMNTFVISVNVLTLVMAEVDVSGKNLHGKIQIRLYKNGNSSLYTETDLEKLVPFLQSSANFHPSKPIVILFHGVAMRAESHVIKTIINAFGKSGKSRGFNVMALNMYDLLLFDKSGQCHVTAIHNTELAGNQIGEYLNKAIDAGLTSPEMLHLVGYCIGAHMAGYTARFIAEEHRPINYIAGLDPAGYGFCVLDDIDKLERDDLGTTHVSWADARIVHLFHTNALFFATDDPLGTADFYFNNGVMQPGCYTGIIGCSHARSAYLFAEVILSDQSFVGRNCDSFASFLKCSCDSNEIGALTFPPDPSVQGVYYLGTRDRSPFGLGSRGAVCYFKYYWERFIG